ncbi:hippurate hydrolase [Apiospora aurea]|uniref:Hippurate hydrolase n=1 Tax=Apiospora aurea TaxID=335848 RepID=A0ABR1Q288_9PEZI
MASISSIVAQHRPDLGPLQDLYKHFHEHPELSNQEKETAAAIAAELGNISPDFDIKMGIGGHGLAAILRNNGGGGVDENGGGEGEGEGGPTVLLRADIDALPVLERTGLPYASTRRMRDVLDGVEKPVMHACGHDMHITSLLGAARTLVSSRALWRGTLVLAFQPAEERGTGAQAMVDDGLYSPARHAVPVPDVVLGAHVTGAARTGVVGTRRGLMATSADSLRVTLHGRGGHASMPHAAVDPVLMAASTILKLQTIVSRETDPADSAVVTVASVHAGDAENIIADEARLSVESRAVTQRTRDRTLRRIREIVRAECLGAQATREPTFETTRAFPLTINDEEVTARVEATFAAHFGEGKGQPTVVDKKGANEKEQGEEKGMAHECCRYDRDIPRFAASEDFSILATAVGKPYCFFMYGGVDGEAWDRAEARGTLAESIPSNHSALFAPAVMPTLRVGLDGYAAAALTFLGKKGN